uniref:GRIP domain-containing protein n=1 Tax=Strongyloides venezuelensis TaxID=75913 RepID=A0A0K0EXR0_STRVS
MKNSKISSSAQSYLESLQQETRKLLAQKQGTNTLSKNYIQKSNQKEQSKNQNATILSESIHTSDITSSIDSDILDESLKRTIKKKSKIKDSLTSTTSNEFSSNQNGTEKGNDNLSDSNRYSITSIPADKYLKMIRYSIDTSLFMGTKNDVNSDEISPLSSTSNISNKIVNKPSNHINSKVLDINSRDVKKLRSNFKIGSLVNRNQRQETIMEAENICKNDNIEDETINKEKVILPMSVFRKKRIVIGKTKIRNDNSRNFSKRNINFSSSISESINSEMERISESSSISTVKHNYKLSKKDTTSIHTSLSSIFSSKKVTTSTSSITTISTTDSSSVTKLSSTSSTVDSSDETSSSETLTTFSESTSITLTKEQETKNDTSQSFDELSSIHSYVSEKLTNVDIKYNSRDSERSSQQSFYSISEENPNNERKNIYQKNEKEEKFQNRFRDTKLEINGYKNKLSLLEDKRNIKFNKNDILKNILFPYITNLKIYMDKEKRLSDIIEKNLYNIYCKDSTEKAIENIFTQS